MPDLIALDLPGGPDFVDALRSVWDAGDAALPVDQRIPAPARDRLFAALRPDAVVGPDGRRVRRPTTGPAPEPGDALVVPTSGTAGTPKGVVLTHDALIAHARAVHRRLEVDPGTDRWLACLPLSHIGGLGVVVRAVVTGTPLDVLPGFDAGRVTAAADSGATLVSLVPTALDRIGSRRFRWVVLGGAADAAGRDANVVRTYGLTETGGGVVYDHGGPLDGVEVRTVDGEIQLRGPTLLRAYRDGRDPRTADGWLPTGDLGAIAPDGSLAVHGRSDDLIVTGGENVWPETVEAVLRTHDAIDEVAVVGRPDPEWGARVVAHVVPTDRLRPPSLEELRRHVKEVLPAYAAPRELVVTAALPKTGLGKIRRAVLRAGHRPEPEPPD